MKFNLFKFEKTLARTRVQSVFALSAFMRFHIFCVGTVLVSHGLLGCIFGVFLTVFMAFVKSGVRETAVRLHIDAQNCGKKTAF